MNYTEKEKKLLGQAGAIGILASAVGLAYSIWHSVGLPLSEFAPNIIISVFSFAPSIALVMIAASRQEYDSTARILSFTIGTILVGLLLFTLSLFLI